ncbi:MAG: sulfite exporter TauE/SafE family protein [Microcella sp.]|uniref:sulfite exporter TauE/SafE family protein n=1 Tax=Microcella sp. TaxID=1913979 RepID=UPI0024C82612|nr:sulfite exporter TauE/SafE family protein [Microcella sp.]UYN82713.1 MAG: sulfite exporter TauE/SafE family protein [Microcella sp.]
MTLALLAVGAIGGLFSGLFGVGGGLLMVPLLMWWARMPQRRATATSLLAIVPTGIVGSIGYAIGGQIDVLAGVIIGAGAIAGAPLGTLLLRRLPIVWLRWMLIAGMLAAAVYLMLVEPDRGAALALTPASVAGLVLLGVTMGVLAGLFGIGGGIVAVPVLIALFGMGDLLAKGTSLVAMIPAAVVGTLSNRRARLVRVRDGLIVGAAAVVFSLAGVALAFVIPPALSGLLFGLLLVAAAVQLIVRTLRQPRTE